MSEPWTLINIDGQNRPLRFNGTAFRDFEVAYARSIGVPEYPFGKVVQRLFLEATRFETLTSYNLLAHLLWAGLKWRWSTLQVDQALGLVSDFEEKGGDLIVEVWGPIEAALLGTGMFKHLIKRVDDEARPGNREAETKTPESESPSSASVSAPGTSAQPA